MSCGRLVMAGVLAAAVGHSGADAAMIIDFEDWTGGGGPQYLVVSGGFTFAGLLSVSPDAETDNPTNALHSLDLGCKVIQPSGLPFAIYSLDLQEGLGASETVSVKLVGHRSESDVIQTFYLDGQTSTYETFCAVGFTDLSGVHFSAYDAQGIQLPGFSVDNIVVPEPFSIALLAAAFLALVVRK